MRFFFLILASAGFLFTPRLHGQQPDQPQRGMTPVRVTIDGSPTPLYDQSHALVIGVSSYTDGLPALPGAEADVSRMKTLLERMDFNTVLVMNPTSEGLMKAFTDFIASYGQDAGNRLLFYFAGQGFTEKLPGNEVSGYLCPSDAPDPRKDPKTFQAVCLSMNQIENFASQIKSKHCLFLLDACVSGSVLNLSPPIPASVSFKSLEPVRQFIISGSSDETISDWNIFPGRIELAISGEADQNRDGFVTGTELGDFLQNGIVKATSGRQHPQFGLIKNNGLAKGDFIFVVTKPPAPPPVVVKSESGYPYPFDKNISPTGTKIQSSTGPGRVVIADAVFSTETGGRLKFNYPVSLKVLVQNTGQNESEAVNMVFDFPNPDCVVLGESDRYQLGKLRSGESKVIDFLFTATRRYHFNAVPVRMRLSGANGKLYCDTVFTVGMDQELVSTNNVRVKPLPVPSSPVIKSSQASDIDKDVPPINNYEALSDEALKCARNKDFNKAAILYLTKIKLGAGSSVDYYNLGKIYYNLKDFNHADSILAIVNSMQPDYIAPYLWRARSLSNIDSTSERGLAMPVYEKIIDKTNVDIQKYSKERSEAYFYCAYYFFLRYSKTKNQSDGFKSVYYCDHVIEIDPSGEFSSKAKQIKEMLQKFVKQ